MSSARLVDINLVVCELCTLDLLGVGPHVLIFKFYTDAREGYSNAVLYVIFDIVVAL